MKRALLKSKIKFSSRFNDLYSEFLHSHSNEIVITENDLINRKLEDQIIVESVFKDKDFVKLFEYVNNLNENNFILNPKKIADYFPIKSKIRRTLLKPFFNKLLYVSIVNENSIDGIEDAVHFWTNLNDENAEFREFVADIYNLFGNADALFYELNEKGVMFLRRDKFSLGDFKHEFIHYYNWTLKNNQNIEVDQDWLFEIYENKLKAFMTMFELDESDIEYFSDFDEFETLLNDAIVALLKIKKEKFNEMSSANYADLVFNDFFYNKKKTTFEQYLDKLKESEFIDEINENLSLKFIIFNVIINYNVNRIKMHIFSILKDKTNKGEKI